MRSETLAYEADGLAMRGELYFDPSIVGPRPGILLFPEAFGLGAHALARAERLSALGFVVLACDLHGERAIHNDFPTVIALLETLKAAPERIRAQAKGGLDALLARPEVDPARIAAIGYCFGGSIALEMARSGQAIVAAIGFHSGLAPADADAIGAIRAKVLVCVGADDPSIDPAQRATFEAEMHAAGADWQLHVYGGVAHSFTDPAADARGAPDFARYDARADARSWAAMLTLLEDVFAA